MKVRFFLSFIFFLTNVLVAQTFRVVDSCSNNVTEYQLIAGDTSSLNAKYKVKSFYNGILIFDGFIVNPLIHSQLPDFENKEFLENYENQSKVNLYDGLCYFFNNIGQALYRIRFDSGKIIELSKYTNKKITYYFQKKNDIILRKYYDSSGKAYNIIQESKKKRKSTYFVNDKKYTSKERYNPKTKTYTNTNRKFRVFKEDGYLSSSAIKYFWSKHQKEYRQYGDSNKLIDIKRYNRKGKLLSEIQYPSNQSNTIEMQYTYNRKLNHLLVFEKYSFYPNNYIDSFTFSYFPKTDAFQIFSSMKRYFFSFPHGNRQIVVKTNKSEDGFDSIFYINTGKKIQIKGFVDGKLLQTRTLLNKEYLYETSNLIHIPYEEILNKFKSLKYFPSVISGLNYIDSFYSNGQLIGIVYENEDTLRRYKIENNRKTTTFDTYAYRIAKDAIQCTEGLKDQSGKWIIKAEYAFIKKHLYDTLTLYFGSKGDYTAVFNWKGDLLIPPTRGLEFPDNSNFYYYQSCISLTPEEQKKLKLKYNKAFVVNDILSKTYRLLSLDNKVIQTFPGEISLLQAASGYVQNHRNHLFVVRDKSGRCGLANLDSLLIPLKYNRIKALERNHYEVLSNENNSTKHFILDSSGNLAYDSSFFRIHGDMDTTVLVFDSEMHPAVFSLKSYRFHSTYKPYQLIHNYTFQRRLLVEENGLKGYCDYLLNPIISNKYERISYHGNNLLARLGDSIDFFNYEGVFLNRLVCDSFPYNQFERKSYANNQFFNDEIDNQLFQKSGLFGMVDGNGKLLLPPKYTFIAKASQGLIMLQTPEQTVYGRFEDSGFKEVNPFPLPNLLNFYGLTNSKTRGFVSYDGKEINYTDGYGFNFNRMQLKAIQHNGVNMGLINSLGQWVFKSNLYQQTSEFSKSIYYVQTKNAKSGLVSCSGNEIIKPAHQYIAYDKENNLLWFNSRQIPSQIVNSDVTRNIWSVKNLKTGKIYPDTFHWPCHFYKGIAINKNKNGKWGAYDTALNTVLPFEYESVECINDNYYFYKKNSIEVYDRTLGIKARLNLDLISPLGNHYIGYKNNMAFLFDQDFRSLAKSQNFFDNNLSLLANSLLPLSKNMPDNDLANLLHQLYRLYFGDKKYQESFYNGEERIKAVSDSINPKIVNFIICLHAIERKKENNLYPNREIRTFPPFNYISQYSNYSHFPEYPYNEMSHSDWDYRILPFAASDNFQMTYSPDSFSFADIAKHKYLHPISICNKYACFSYNSNPISGRNSYYYNNKNINLLFEGKSILKVYLNEIIDENKTAAFNTFILEQTKKLDDPLLPCLKQTDYLELFENQFVVKDHSIVFTYTTSVDLEISFEELKPFLHPFWKEKLLP